MDIESARFYRVRDGGSEKIVFALRDIASSKVRLIDHLTAGIEEAFEPADCVVLACLGSSEEFWKDDFARQVMRIMVAEEMTLDPLESVALVSAMRDRAIASDNVDGVRALANALLAERRAFVVSRAKLWKSLTQ